VRFPLAPSSVTLYDLELLLCLNFLGISHNFADLGGKNGYTNEDRPIVSPVNVLFNDV